MIDHPTEASCIPNMIKYLFVISVFVLQHLLGFTQAPTYQGWRLSIYQFADLKATKDQYSFLCSVVNTGREPVQFDKQNPPNPKLVFELDTLALPKELKGRRSAICQSLLENKINLKPGDAVSKIRLTIPMKTIDGQASNTPKPEPSKSQAKLPSNTDAGFDYVKSCPDLRFDTAYIVERTKQSLTIRYVLRNMGSSTARLLGDSDAEGDNLAVNVYFNRATKLTRGALLADGAFIKEGVETQNGLLFPNARLFGEIVVSRKNHSVHTPNIILEVDPFTSIVECSKTNNTFVISDLGE